MPGSPQARAASVILRRLGEESTLRGVSCGRVNVQRQVILSPGMTDTSDDNFVVRYDVATIAGAYAPKVGDVLVHPSGSFVLDRLIDDNGHNQRFIVR